MSSSARGLNLTVTHGSGLTRQLQDQNNNIIAFYRPIKPARYNIGDVYGELHFVRNAGAGVVVCPRFCGLSDIIVLIGPSHQMHPPLMDTVTVTAMLYRFVITYGL